MRRTLSAGTLSFVAGLGFPLLVVGVSLWLLFILGELR